MNDKQTEKIYGHGNHWDAITTSKEDFTEILVKAINTEADSKIYKGVKPYAGILGFNPPIRIFTLIKTGEKANEMWSAYPFLQVDNPIQIRLDKIDEWPGGVEAVLTGTATNGMIVSFFDTFYFMNKEKYKVGQDNVFNIAGLAYTFKKRDSKILEFTPDEGPMKGQKVSTHGMTGYQLGDVYTDDFVFMNSFKGFGSTYKLYNTKFYEFRYYHNSMEDDVAPLYFPIFVKTDLLGGYKPQPDDDIDGTGWLQGYLEGSLGE